MKSNACPNLGIYFSHYECFGHVSRVMAIAEVFKKRFPQGNLFFIQAGIPHPSADLNRWGRVYQLPHPYVSRKNFSQPSQVTQDVLEERKVSLGKILSKEKPRLFITELFPLGREESRHELIPTLVQCSCQGTKIWAIAGYPLLTDLDGVWREKIIDLYQKILILSPQVEKDYLWRSLTVQRNKEKYLDFFHKYQDKISFGGYLLPSQAIVKGDLIQPLKNKSKMKDVCNVAVVRGGGVCYPKLIAQAIRASELLGEQYFFNVVAGPSTTDKEWALFCLLLKKKRIKNLVLYRSVANYEDLIKKSHVCVSIASYHSAAMLLRHRKSSVVVPFLGYSQKMRFCEQTARAKLLHAIIGAQIVSINQLTAMALSKAIRRARQRQNTFQIPAQWFGGYKNLDRALANFFNRI